MKSYSQRNQDLFVLSILNEKTNGTYLDFGCRGPIDINNTYLLENNYNFSGLSFDIDSNEILKWKTTNRNYKNAICGDLLELDFVKILENNYKSTNIDYFSFDLEPPLVTLEVLKKFPFNKYKFGVITFEHDFYRGFDTLRPSREIFIKNGYRKIKMEHMKKFETEMIWFSEDWWIHPDLVTVPEEYLDETIIDFTEQDLINAGLGNFSYR
uniref:Methyltransferase n=1 Tax=viral metagenome TaxID=1070528 RepID=A0A6C0B006_9ZZZZ